MEKEILNKQNKSSKEGYIIVPNYFLKKWVSVLGVGPVVLYQELLTYCHKEKYIAWPTIDSLCQQMGIAKTTLLRYQDTLIKFGLIKNITRGKSTTGHYRNNIYQVISLEELSRHPDPGKIIDFVGSKMKPDWYQNDTYVGSKMKLSLVSKRYPNNTNLNITNTTTTTNREKDAVAVVVNFKKLKEEGEERMRAPYNSKEHYTGQAIKERMVELDFKEEFIEKILKEYSTKKIDEKLDQLLNKKNIQNPPAWLKSALKNDYQDAEQQRHNSEPVGENEDDKCRGVLPYAPPPNVIANDRRERSNLNSLLPSPLEGEGQGEGDTILSTEEARERFKLLREKLMAMKSP